METRQKRLKKQQEYEKEKRGDAEDKEARQKRLKQNAEYKKKMQGDEENQEVKKERLRKKAEKAKENYWEKINKIAKDHQTRQYEQTEFDRGSHDTKLTRRIGFLKAVHLGPILVCSCCSQKLFRNAVSEVTTYLKQKIKEKNEEMINCLLGYTSPDTKIYICSTCRNSLSEGRMPAMAVSNGLEITDIEDGYELTELENNLIAQNINFQKMILLPKSRWAAGKGRMVSVPVEVQDVMNTMKQIPRLPEEAGLIPIKLKRKKMYKGYEKNELVRPEKLFKVLQKLKEKNHPYYQSYDTQEEYTAREKEKEDRYKRTQQRKFGEDDVEENMSPIPQGTDFCELGDEVLMEEELEDLEDELAKDEEDIQNDPVRRQHFNYSANSVLVNGHPEIMLDKEGNQVADTNFAPAEGKIPVNFLDQKDWDIKSWPILHPDGQFGMDHPREIKITKQKYFQQRIQNKNNKFARTPGYVFGAVSYVESERLRSNANLSGYRGKKETDEDGQVSYNMKNPFTVFDKVPNTPKYWQNVKFEMMAKMENMGPFHWFFTLSCGDKRWCANFYKYFEENEYGLEVVDEGCVLVTKIMDKKEKDKKGWKTVTENGKRIRKQDWDVFKDSKEFDKDISKHEEIRNDVLLATRNFQHRVEMFRKEVMFGNKNPMKVRHITYRVEFQGRGAGHIHGVLWVDLEEVNIDMKEEIDAAKEQMMEELIFEDVKVMEDLLLEHLNTKSETVLVEAYDKLRRRTKLTKTETRALEVFADKFCTCSLNSLKVGEKVVKIAKEVNQHGHSKSCKKVPPKCRWKFPKFPIDRTVFIDVNRDVPEQEMLEEKTIAETLERVKKVLVEDKNGKEVVSKKVEDIIEKYPRNKNTIRERIEEILKEASKDGEGQIEYKTYVRALEQNEPGKGCKLHLQRDIDKIFINNYNPEWIESWDSNIDISLVSDFYGAITYITDYWTKDSSGLTDVLRTAVKQLGKDDGMKKRCHELANIFISHRQIGEAEAYYKLLPHMNLSYSSVVTTYIPTVAKRDRRHFLQKQDPDAGKGFKVKDMGGRFLEKPDLISKYERRMVIGSEGNEEWEGDNDRNRELEKAERAIKLLTYSQFAKMYESCPKAENHGKLASKDKLNFVIVGDEKKTKRKDNDKIEKEAYNKKNEETIEEEGVNDTDLELPATLQLKNPLPGEPQFLRKRNFPKAIRFYKQKEDTHEFFLQELIMFLPFQSESELFPDDEEKCRIKYTENYHKIDTLKAKVMPFLESVKSAQALHEEMKESGELDLEEVAALLDPEKEQEIMDAEEEEEEEHPEYLHINPDQVEEEAKETSKKMRVFRSIEIPSNQTRLEEARKLDIMQKYVLSVGIRYAKGVVRSRKCKYRLPIPPRMMVHGGAGSGKSCVIKPLAEWMQYILQEQGDDPDSPYVVLSSFTGAASANINGQTLHSLFGFKFGTKFMSLTDQKRDEARCRFRNLKAVIVDEISMVSADLFYNFDLKLREIMQVNSPFGGIAIFFIWGPISIKTTQGKICV